MRWHIFYCLTLGIVLFVCEYPEVHGQQLHTQSCKKSLTEVNGQTVCSGENIFKEHFNSSLSRNKWAPEIFIPEFDFVIFRAEEENRYVKNGKLHIKPTILEDDFVRRGRLDLQSCTGKLFSSECMRQATSFSIIPPIASARITTRESFSFKYGTVNIRAKLPEGDWILPEIWLEPKNRMYGSSFASGRIRIAMSRGNRNLIYGDQDIGNNKLESGILMGVGDNIRGRTVLRNKIDGWYRNFHDYSLKWTPDNIHFSVDGELEESIRMRGKSLAESVGFSKNMAQTWSLGSKLAPFDQEFYISLGLSVGGMREFPDGSTSGGHSKPWKNMAVKALVNFWKDKNYWEQTWTEKSLLQIEHVKVNAL